MTPEFNETVKFCFFGGVRDSIRLECNDGWEENFQLYSGNQNTAGLIKVYNYAQDAGRTNRLSLYPITQPNYGLSGLPYIYLKGK